MAPALWVTVKHLAQSWFRSLIKVWERKNSREDKGVRVTHMVLPIIVPMVPRATRTYPVVIVLKSF